jgi:hypothetical protein
MSLDQIIQGALTTLQSHVQLPFDAAWVPTVSAAVVAAGGLLMMMRGARWAPALAAVAFLGVGGFGGWNLAGQISTPPPLTAAVAGVLAAFIGVGFFRLWQAGLLAAVLMVAGISAYFARDLRPQVQAWVDAAPASETIELPAAGTVVGETAATWQSRAGDLWNHLSASVPGFQTTFYGILAGTGLIGLIFGIAFPRVSRSLWASSIGVALGLLGTGGLLQQHAPAALDWARTNGSIAWAGVGVIWLTSVLYNYRTLPRRGRVLAPDPAPAAA